jgi:hypothetical protein
VDLTAPHAPRAAKVAGEKKRQAMMMKDSENYFEPEDTSSSGDISAGKAETDGQVLMRAEVGQALLPDCLTKSWIEKHTQLDAPLRRCQTRGRDAAGVSELLLA